MNKTEQEKRNMKRRRIGGKRGRVGKGENKEKEMKKEKYRRQREMRTSKGRLGEEEIE
jgi:hypothetical protein